MRRTARQIARQKHLDDVTSVQGGDVLPLDKLAHDTLSSMPAPGLCWPSQAKRAQLSFLSSYLCHLPGRAYTRIKRMRAAASSGQLMHACAGRRIIDTLLRLATLILRTASR
jgi:hypothetical protein